jgi:hypothetical protein
MNVEDENEEEGPTLSLWMETKGTHRCEDLLESMQDAIYELARVRYKGKLYMAIIPNIDEMAVWSNRHLLQARLRYCPFCGFQMKLRPLPKAIDGDLNIPDELPPNIG